jgi:F0F1-type ATP synthase membrane subunit c/vacuolar-type H+-ATPase subunit K
LINFPNTSTNRNSQSARQYSSEAPKGKSLAPVYLAVGLAGVGAGLYRYNSGAATAVAEAPKDRPKVFTGGDQGWVDLKLSNIEILSHNTKRLRFEFADKEAVSGLHVACELFSNMCVVQSTYMVSSCSLDQVLSSRWREASHSSLHSH